MEDKAEADQKIKNLTNCEYCHHKFHKPVVLPCGDTLCEKHLTEMIQCTDESQHHIFCFFCGQQHLLDGQIGYPENKVLQRLVDIETTKSEIRYEEVKTMCNKLRSKIIEIEEIQKSPGDFITDYFNKVNHKTIKVLKVYLFASNKLSLLDQARSGPCEIRVSNWC